jgi:hypothetical protein
MKFMDSMGLGPDAPIRGKTSQRGSGSYTLCNPCNNKTGRWYAPALIDWCYRGMEILERSNGNPKLFSLYHTYPLRVLKQILVMFCSVNGPDFTDAQPWLRRYLLNEAARGFDDSFRLFVYYNLSRKARFAGMSGSANFETGTITVISEITYPPFGYALTVDSASPDHRLADITFFSRFSYNELARLEVKLPVLPIHLAYPGDYRTREEILADRETGELALEEMRRHQNASSTAGP